MASFTAVNAPLARPPNCVCVVRMPVSMMCAFHAVPSTLKV